MKAASVRRPAVAGMFYPADPRELRAMISEFMDQAAPARRAPKAVIAPHAGYVYSGPIAASVYAQVAPAARQIRRVILFGPSHRVPFTGLAASGADAFATPLGEVPLDREILPSLADLKQVRVLDQAHAQEHSLEVQLPFLQHVLPSFKLVPLAVGDASPKEVAEVMDRLWGGPETLVVVSSDLSHYNDYKTASRMDRATSDAIEQLRPEAIDYEQACGRIPIAGLLLVARKRGLKARTVDLRSSGDTAGPRDEVVGYGGYVFDEE
ncbi:MAG: hypothetical protein BWY59_00384 [Verrucomicrobia bacterium ADurb.Bin345]|nr:MAG: hypothetical protein BWY59_00384 [Verrucomicrobia bacterium ADurb.Bin345]